MKIKTENLGAYGLLLSVVLILIGILHSNIISLIIGGLMFMKLISVICHMAAKGAEVLAQEAEAKAYAIKKNADTKADLLAKAYHDKKISDEDISFLVRSLASDVKQANTTQHKAIVTPQPVQAIEFKPVVETQAEVVEEVEAVEDNNKDNQIIPFVVEGGRFVFNYNDNKIAFSPQDVIKGEALHKEFDDSFGYYKNADAIFYIYPVDKKIVAVSI